MAALADYTNVLDTALSVLIKKGYQVWFDKMTSEYWAEKDGWDYVSSSPVALLGLVAIYEFHQPTAWTEYWWRIPADNLARRLPSVPKPYVAIYRRK